MGLDSYIFRTKKDRPHFENYSDTSSDEFYEYVDELWYARKANALHRWFVDNVQEGEDDCRVALISEEKLEKLEAILDKIVGYWDSTGSQGLSDDDRIEKIKDKCAKILPVRKGFFFGDYGYDYYFYMWPILDLRKNIKYLLNNGDIKKYNYYYNSSW